MPYKKVFPVVIITLTALLTVGQLYAQSPPVISYTPPTKFSVNKPITPLVPINAGGAVPPNVYGTVTTFAGSGAAGFTDETGTKAQFNAPVDITFDKFSGNFYVADQGNYAIRMITPAGVVTTLAGGIRGFKNANGVSAQFYDPVAVGTDIAGNIFVGDNFNQLIRRIDPQGNVTTYSGVYKVTGNANGALASATYNYPTGIMFDAAGDLLVCDYRGGLIRKINIATGKVITLAGNGTLATVDGIGTNASFNAPGDITHDSKGNLFVADQTDNVIRKIDANTLEVTTVATGIKANGIVMNGTDDMYVANGGGLLIKEISADGKQSVVAGGIGMSGNADNVGELARFADPFGITIDNNGFLYVADRGNNQIKKIGITGYTIDKQLPPGMFFDVKTGIISGTPTTVWPLTTYTITGHNAAGSDGATIDIDVEPPGELVFNPIPPKTTCDADQDPGAASAKPITYTSSDPAVATIVNNKIHIIGIGTATITADDGVTSLTQPLVVTAPAAPLVTISASATDVFAGTTVTFTATVQNTPIMSYQWYVNGLAAGTNSATFTTDQLVNGDIVTCEVTSADCGGDNKAVSNAVTIIVKKTSVITVANAFTPNGDGINDLWTIDDLAIYPACTVNVYNRYGVSVFHSVGYSKPWNGTVSNAELPVGTYYYVIDPKEANQQVLKGWVSILR